MVMNPLDSRRNMSFLWLAIASGFAIAILSIALIWHQRAENHTRLTANLANTAEITAAQIESSLDGVDTLLKILARRYENYNLFDANQRAFLEQQLRNELVFYSIALRVVLADQFGNQLINTGVPFGHEGALPNLIDRQYYQRAIAGERGLMYEGPVAAKLDARESMLMVRPVEGSDGAFQGMVIAVLPTERLGHGFENIDLGRHSVVNLRTTDLSLVVRYPVNDSSNELIGSIKAPDALKEQIANNPDQLQHMLRARSAIDGVERVYTVQKLPHSPFWLSVGMSEAEFESGWRLTGGLVMATSALVLLMLFLGARKLDAYRFGLEHQVAERTKNLTQSEARYRALAELDETIFEAMPVGLAVVNSRGEITRVNARLVDLLGYSREELEGLPLRHVLPGEPSGYAIRKDKQQIPVDCGLSDVGEGADHSQICIVMDMSEVRRHADELAHAKDQADNARLRLFNATQTAGIGVWIWNIQTGSLVWDRHMFELYGVEALSTDQAVQYDMWANRVHPADLAMAEDRIKDLLDGTGPYNPEFRIVLPSGDIRYIKGSAFMECDAQGLPHYMVGLNQDVTEMRQSQLDLEEAQRLAKVGSWRFDLNSERVEWSAALYTIFGLDSQQAAPDLTAQASIFTPDSWVLLQHSIGRAIDVGEPYAIELEFKRPDGELCWILARGERVVDAKGHPVLLRGTAADITFQKRQEMLLKEARLAAESANHAKSNFLSIMSHEIRTPLNAIIGTSYLLGLDSLTDKQRVDVSTISASSKSLLALINDVLDFSKIEAGELELEQQPFALKETLVDLKDMFAALALQKGLVLNVDEVPESLPPVLLGDSNRLKQILINLLNNSIKFTAAGSVELTVTEYSPGQHDQVFLRLEVKDTGIGIPPEAQSRLFSPFMQAEASTSRKYGGTGLGLSIVKRITELMRGNIRVQSEVGSGTTFTLDLPFAISTVDPGMLSDSALDCRRSTLNEIPAPAPELAQPVVVDDSTPGELKGLRVMVVDDSQINLQITRRILEKEGAVVTLCGSGACAVQHISEQVAPNVILMDLQMPEMDGCEATLRIRQQLADYIPILALTAGATTTEQDRALASGMTGFLTKPIDPRGLVRALKALLNRSE